jgi:hypothetical protein
VEDIKVKERLALVVYFISILGLSFCDSALWNDGTHFLFRLIDQGVFIDHLWNRYADILFELPTLLSLKVLGPGVFSTWLFKATLLLLPFMILALRYWRSTDRDSEANHFLLAVIFLIIPFSLMFPISTINLSLCFGALILHVLLKKQLTFFDLILFSLSHLVLFFGHDFGALIPVFVIGYCLLQLGRPLTPSLKLKHVMLAEILFLLGLIIYRYPIWLKNSDYVGETDFFDYEYYQFFFPYFVSIGLMSFSKRLSRFKWLQALLVLVFVWGIYQMKDYMLYSSTYHTRYFMLPALLVLFVICLKATQRRLPWSFFLSSCLMLGAIELKAIHLWWHFKLPEVKGGGCFAYPVDPKQWMPPEWTISYYSLIKQNSIRPERIFIPSLYTVDGQCQRYGSSIVYAKDFLIHVNTFKGRISPELFTSQNIQQVYEELPYEDKDGRLRLPFEGSLGFNLGSMLKETSCLYLKIEGPPLLSRLIFELDGKNIHEEEVSGLKDILLEIKRPSEKLLVTVKTPEQIIFRDVRAVACPIQTH